MGERRGRCKNKDRERLRLLRSEYLFNLTADFEPYIQESKRTLSKMNSKTTHNHNIAKLQKYNTRKKGILYIGSKRITSDLP